MLFVSLFFWLIHGSQVGCRQYLVIGCSTGEELVQFATRFLAEELAVGEVRKAPGLLILPVASSSLAPGAIELISMSAAVFTQASLVALLRYTQFKPIHDVLSSHVDADAAHDQVKALISTCGSHQAPLKHALRFVLTKLGKSVHASELLHIWDADSLMESRIGQRLRCSGSHPTVQLMDMRALYTAASRESLEAATVGYSAFQAPYRARLFGCMVAERFPLQLLTYAARHGCLDVVRHLFQRIPVEHHAALALVVPGLQPVLQQIQEECPMAAVVSLVDMDIANDNGFALMISSHMQELKCVAWHTAFCAVSRTMVIGFHSLAKRLLAAYQQVLDTGTPAQVDQAGKSYQSAVSRLRWILSQSELEDSAFADSLEALGRERQELDRL